MNKNLMIIVAVIIILILGIGGYMVLGKSKSTSPTSENTQKTEDKNAFTSIQDAIARSISLECSYQTPEGTKVKAYIKGGQVRSDITGTTADQSGSAIIKGKKVYFWNSQGGFMMEIPDVSVTPAKGQSEVENKGASTMEALEQYKQYCKPASVSDTYFVIPANVKFQDMSEMMKMMTPSGTKSGTNAVPSIDQKQIEEMMKQYSNPEQ